MTRTLLFAILVAVAGCNRASIQEKEVDRKAMRDENAVALGLAAAPEPASAPAEGRTAGFFRGQGAGQGLNAAPARMIVRSASLTLIVTDVPAVVRQAAEAVKPLDGFIGDARQWREGDRARARLTIRVPSAHLDELLASVRSWAVRVDNEAISGEDVTRQYVDLSAQLTNLQATERELRELLVTVRQRTRKASEVLEVHNELSRIRGEIDRTQGELQSLSQLAALSTATLDLFPDIIGTPVASAGWQPLAIAHEAAAKLVDTFRVAAGWVIWIAIYAAPIGVVMLVFGWGALRTVRRMRIV